MTINWRFMLLGAIHFTVSAVTLLVLSYAFGAPGSPYWFTGAIFYTAGFIVGSRP